jgi:hypothetical protein
MSLKILTAVCDKEFLVNKTSKGNEKQNPKRTTFERSPLSQHVSTELFDV